MSMDHESYASCGRTLDTSRAPQDQEYDQVVNRAVVLEFHWVWQGHNLDP
jgi:hypothetical protein